MISANSLLLSVSGAQYFQEKGLTVKAKADTALGEVLNAMPILPIPTMSGDTYFEELGAMLEALSTGTLDNPSAHDCAIGELDNKISVFIKQHMSFAKNTVVPMINEYSNMMQQFKDNFIPKPAASTFNIIQYETPTLIKDPVFVEWLSVYNKELPLDPISQLNLGERTNDELLNLMSVGDGEIDLAMSGWAAKQGDNFIQKIWNSFFNVSVVDNTNVYTIGNINLLDEVSKMHVLLGVFLLARGLFSTVDSNAKNMTLKNYSDITSSWRDWAGGRLYYSIERVSDFVKKGTMVLTVDSNKKECGVVGEVYRDWLLKGGTPETLLGLMVSGKRLVSTQAIDDDQENLLSRWNSYTAFHDNSEFNKTIVYFKNALTVNFGILMDRVTEEECLLNPGYRLLAKKYFEEELDTITNSDISDLDDVCMRLICRARYYFTDSEKILRGINEAAKHNPMLSVQEAAFVSMTDYIVDYVSDQMYVTTEL